MLTAPGLVNMLAEVANDDVAAIWGVDVHMVDAADTDLLREGDGGDMGSLSRGSSLQNASIPHRNSARKDSQEKS